MADYPYRLPDFDEWAASVELDKVTLRATFDAGERYGADLQRGGIYQSLDELSDEATDDGESLVDCLRRKILEEEESDSLAWRSR